MACAHHILTASETKLSPFNRMGTHFLSKTWVPSSGRALPGLALFLPPFLLLLYFLVFLAVYFFERCNRALLVVSHCVCVVAACARDAVHRYTEPPFVRGWAARRPEVTRLLVNKHLYLLGAR
ncbi:hypothetical protein GMDG_01641 [Pseudogymnoascus destructans 20631-21]|uniref:Uncharacterized protein n=1 Tax=Pseudogymnoascus destructans (strain ATCC MYA-4855 / 20631-21) TaxID=658429 RepID=L8FZC9_PSED2|nr:hypothetical protein GMDG_01641 [Pseudogymnoascus destructans 20631-21]